MQKNLTFVLTVVTFVLSFCHLALAASRTSPPAGSKVVRAGSTASGEYRTIQAAVDALPQDNSTQTIFIYPGIYQGQVLITRSGPLTIYGYTKHTTSYTGNRVTITASKTVKSTGSNDASGTLRVHKDDFKIYNVNIKNGYGAGNPATAYSVTGNRTGAYGCGFYGYQDTLYTSVGTQVYLKSYIEGAVDFIFGEIGHVYFEHNTIGLLGDGFVTASGRNSDDSSSYVFESNTVVIAPNAASGTSGACYFGRPWRDHAKVIFKNTNVTGLNSAMWSVWSPTQAQTDHVFFADYNTIGIDPSRPHFATELTASQASQYNISSAVGSDYASWVDTSYLSGPHA